MKNQIQIRESILGNENGSVLLITLATATALAIAAGVGFSHASSNQNLLSNNRLTATRNSLNVIMNRYASIGATYRNSIDPTLLAQGVNVSLSSCILSGAAPCVSGQALPAALYAPIHGGGVQQISGQDAKHAVYYDAKGYLCTPTAATACPFQVSTSIVPTCAGGAASCAVADSFQVHYNLMTNGGVAKSGGVLLATIDQYGAPVPLSAILPPLASASASNVNMSQGLTTNGTLPDTTTAVNSKAIVTAALAAAGITSTAMINAIIAGIGSNVANATAIIAALVQAGITNPSIAQTLASAGITSAESDQILSQYAGWDASAIPALAAVQDAISTAPYDIRNAILIYGSPSISVAQSFVTAVSGITDLNIAANEIEGGVKNAASAQATLAAITASGITDTTMQGYLAQGLVTSASQAIAIAAAITDSGATGDIADEIAKAGITNVATATMFKDAGIDQDAAQIYQNMQLTTDSAIQKAIVYGEVTQPAVAQTIITAGITNPNVAAGLSDSNITNAATATALANSVAGSTLTSPLLEEAAVAFEDQSSAIDSALQTAADNGTINVTNWGSVEKAAANVSHVTDPGIAAAILGVTPYGISSGTINAINQAGITSTVVANGLAEADITSVSMATEINKAVIAAGAGSPAQVQSIIASIDPGATFTYTGTTTTTTTTVAQGGTTTTTAPGSSTPGNSGPTNTNTGVGVGICHFNCGIRGI